MSITSYVRGVGSGEPLISYVYLQYVTDIPSPFFHHNGDCCLADVPRFGSICLQIAQRVRNFYTCVPFLAHCRFSTHENIQNNGLVFSKTKPFHAVSIPVNRVSLATDEFCDQHPTSQPGCHVPSISTDDEVHEKLETQEKRSDLHLDSDDVYCGV